MTRLLIFFCMLSVPSFGQINIINRSLADSTLNIVYLGVENAIELTGIKAGNNKLTFSATNGSITDMSNGRYVLRPVSQGECIVNFHNKGQRIASKIFRADTLGNLIARLAGIKDSFATVQKILTNPFLVLEFPETFFKHNFSVRKFNLSIFTGDFQDTNPYLITGHIIPPDVTRRIKELRKGDYILFDQIVALCPYCRGRKLSPFKIMIK